MDKLEFDARLAQLERRVSQHSALILASLVLVGLFLLFLLRSGQSETSLRSATIATPAPLLVAPRRAVPDAAEGSVGRLASQLRDLSGLQQKSVLTRAEYESKKAQLLARPLRSEDLVADLEQVAELQKENVVTTQEYQALKAKILDVGK
jgi:hypothetical protein